MAVMQQDTARVYPFPRVDPLAPPPEIPAVRRESAVSRVEIWDGSPAWLVTRYDDIRQILADPAISSNTLLPGFPQSTPTAAAFRTGQRAFNRMDPPQHDDHRRTLSGEFTVRKVVEYRPYLDEMVDELLDAIEAQGGPVDIVSTLALPVPARMITKLLALPEEDSEFFLDRVQVSMSLDSTPEESAQSGRDTLAYFARLIEERWDSTADDIVSRMVAQHVRTGHLTAEELQHILHLLLVGGFDTTANMIALGVLVLVRHPDQLAKLRADPELIPNAVEEMLRYLSVAHHVAYRLATAETTVAGTTIEPGDGVIAPLQAANHDPEVFADPEVFDVTRDARGHLAFGYGKHQCLGQPLARVELQAVFTKLVQRFPGLRLAQDADDLVFRNSIIYGVESVVVDW
jgi:cytochrome P450